MRFGEEFRGLGVCGGIYVGRKGCVMGVRFFMGRGSEKDESG